MTQYKNGRFKELARTAVDNPQKLISTHHDIKSQQKDLVTTSDLKVKEYHISVIDKPVFTKAPSNYISVMPQYTT